jgi:hypothetical protein
MIKKYPTPPVPESILKIAGEVNLRKELRKINTPNDLLGQRDERNQQNNG